DVNGINYVTADHTGINISGASITKAFTLDGLTVDGAIGITYVTASSTYAFTGNVKVSTQPVAGKTPLLNNVGGGIVATIVDGTMKTFGFTVTGSFNFHGLTVSTIGNNSQPFSFQYDVNLRQYELGGGLQVSFDGNTFTADFGQENAPGIIIQNGE